MTKYLYQRLLLMIPTVLLASVLVFLLVRVLPGDLASAALGDAASKEQVEAYREQLGLNDPMVTQYARWISRSVLLDFGESSTTGRGIRDTLRDTLPVTLELALLAMTLGLLIGVPLGMIGAVYRGTPIDALSQGIAILGLSIPLFVIGLLAILLPVIWWGWSPPVTYKPFWEDPLANLGQFALPSIILSLRLAGINARMTRSAMLEVMSSDYIRTAQAKGLTPARVWSRHALRNALAPIVTIAGIQLVALLGGAVIIEQIFGLPGLGRFLLDSVGHRDYLAVQSIVLVMAVAATLINFGVDLSYPLLDPRLRGSR